MKDRVYLHSMRSKDQIAKYLLKALNIFLVLIVFILYGCKGKEVEQPFPKPVVTAPEEEKVTSEPEEAFQDISGETAPVFSDTAINTSPRITVLNVYPQNPVAGDTLKVDVKAFDKEGDTVRFTYQWLKNGEELAETSDNLLITKDFKRGDKISVKIVPDDGERKGAPVEMFVFIANSSPVIKPSAETFQFDGYVYSYRVRAVDPDGDPLTYSLKSAPPGMTIDQENGQLQWNVPPDYKGKAGITVAVNDGNGGEVLQSFTLEIMPELM